MTDSQRLLADYVKDGSETAFRELVARYVNLVHSAAVRLTGGDAHLAQDVTQIVFVDLARMARALSGEVALGGWLHRHTFFVATKTMRGERRRQARERQSLEMNPWPDHSPATLADLAPILDESINRLGAEDRSVILLRYFEQRDFRSVGEVMGTSENTARMRASRALEKLRAALQRRGVAFSAAGLAAVLAADGVTAAPASLAAAVSGAALATAGVGGGATLTLLKLMAMTKLKLGIAGAIAVAGMATPLVLQYQAQAKLRAENLAFHQQVEQLSAATAEHQRLAGLVAQISDSQKMMADQAGDLSRLQLEIASLRTQTNALARLRSDRAKFQATAPTFVRRSGAEVSAEMAGRKNFPKDSWTFGGYESPEGTLQTALAALLNGDLKIYMKTITPEEKAGMDKVMDRDDAMKSFRDQAKANLNQWSGYTIANKQVQPNGDILMQLDVPELGPQTARVVKIDDEWKIELPQLRSAIQQGMQPSGQASK